jgi:hypothetical protein
MKISWIEKQSLDEHIEKVCEEMKEEKKNPKLIVLSYGQGFIDLFNKAFKEKINELSNKQIEENGE